MTSEREELYRRLNQVRRLASSAGDALTQERMAVLIADIEQDLAASEVKRTGAAPE
jgi:hypothetical protein